MNRKQKLKLCNLWLLGVAVLTLASSLQMEICGGKGVGSLSFLQMMYLHCFVGFIMLILIILHLYLHFGTQNWITKIRCLKSVPTKRLCVVFAIMIILSIVALLHVFPQMVHTTVGAVHGKVGFLFLLLCMGHCLKRRKFFAR